MLTKKLKYFEYGSHTVKEAGESSNYDSYKAFNSQNGYCFILCDSHDNIGLKVKNIAVERINYFMEKEYVDNPYEAVQSALIYAGGYIYEYARKYSPNTSKTAISCLCAIVRENKIYYASLGNCNMSLFDGRRLYKLSQNTGFDTPKPNKENSRENIKQAKLLGSDKVASPFVCKEPLVPINGDTVIICTDGLYNHVSEKNLKKILSDPMPVHTKTSRLADMAKKEGGNDSITIHLITFYNLDHNTRKFSPIDKPENDDLPITAKTSITGNPLWDKIIIGIALVIVGYMFYDLFLFRPKPPAIDINKTKTEIQKQTEIVDTITEPEQTDKTKPKSPVDFKSSFNRLAPSDTSYAVQSGDSWNLIYSKFEVCSWFIRNHEQNAGKFDRNENPVSGTKLFIPLKYSADKDYNPNFYQAFSTDKVGRSCQHASETFIKNFKDSIK